MIALTILARILFFIIYPINFAYVIFIKEKFSLKRLNGFFRSDAIAIDQYGNYSFRSIFNKVLIQENGYQFGNFSETVSEVLYVNFKMNKLSKRGLQLYKIIEKIDPKHFDVFEPKE